MYALTGYRENRKTKEPKLKGEITMELKEKVEEYLKKKDISRAAFAKMVGIAESTFSRWFNGNYPGDNAAIERKVEEFLETEAVRGTVKDSKDIVFAMTDIATKIWATLDYCKVQKQMVCIYGDAGCGKTMTSKEWMKDKNNVIYITASPAINSSKAILKRIARAVRTRTSGNKDDLEIEIIDKVYGTDMTLIIDEAQHLNHNTLEMIRSLKESCDIGLALIGNATIYNKLTGKQEAEFAQLFSRLMMRKHIMTEQFTKNDIYKVFGDVGEKEADYLLSVTQSRYGLRGASYLWMNAANNENTTEKGLKSMAREMGIMV